MRSLMEYDSTQDRMDDAVRAETRVAVRSLRDAYQAATKAVEQSAAKAGPWTSVSVS